MASMDKVDLRLVRSSRLRAELEAGILEWHDREVWNYWLRESELQAITDSALGRCELAEMDVRTGGSTLARALQSNFDGSLLAHLMNHFAQEYPNIVGEIVGETAQKCFEDTRSSLPPHSADGTTAAEAFADAVSEFRSKSRVEANQRVHHMVRLTEDVESKRERADAFVERSDLTGLVLVVREHLRNNAGSSNLDDLDVSAVEIGRQKLRDGGELDWVSFRRADVEWKICFSPQGVGEGRHEEDYTWADLRLETGGEVVLELGLSRESELGSWRYSAVELLLLKDGEWVRSIAEIAAAVEGSRRYRSVEAEYVLARQLSTKFDL